MIVYQSKTEQHMSLRGGLKGRRGNLIIIQEIMDLH